MKKQSTNPKGEEVEKLVQDFQLTGSKKMESKIIEKYEKVIKSIARKYTKGNVCHEDLVQVGRLGLLGAIRRFDKTYGNSFNSYAIPTIIGEIKHFLRDKTWSLHVPRRVKELGSKIRKAEEELTMDLQRKPTVHEIAKSLRVKEKDVLEVMELGQAYQTQSLNAPVVHGTDESSKTVFETVGKRDKGYEVVNKKIDVKNSLHVLTTRERKILFYIFIKEKSQKETSKIVGVSQMHVSRIQRTAIKKLRQAVLG